MEITQFEIQGVTKITPKLLEDKRGSFVNIYEEEFYGICASAFVQEYVTYSEKNVLRGMHFQRAPYEQGKLITCLSGLVKDVVVDCRLNSNTYGKWNSLELDGNKKEQIWIPCGVAHGFYCLKDSVLLYKTTASYKPEHECTLAWDDLSVGIGWGIKHIKPILSDKDKNGKSFKELEKYFHDIYIYKDVAWIENL